MYIEMHSIQSFAPSNLNRDDTNSPKDCVFGGVRRARISSQCIKRAIRLEPIFAETTRVPASLRTKRVASWLSEAFMRHGADGESAQMVADEMAGAVAGKMDSKNADQTSVLIYFSTAELDAIARQVLENWEAIITGLNQAKPDKKPLEDIVKEMTKLVKDRTSAPDIAMFGRMLADKPELNLDAACQVAHAISTHRATMEMDFFTAVDDLLPDAETGSGMMGFTSYNSATFYRYARIHWDQLVRNLGNDVGLAARAVEGFLRAAVQAVPTGKQNSFAAQNPPDFLLAVVREDGMSWALHNAFEKPISARGDSGLVTPSIEALDAYWGKLEKGFIGSQKVLSAFTVADANLPSLGAYLQPDCEAWIGSVLASLPREA